MQLQRIVIGVDFRPAALAAAEWTARHLAVGAELVLVHVVSPTAPEGLAAARAAAARRLGELAHSLAPTPASVEIVEGDPALCLAAVAAARDADLVVVGAHGDRPGPWDRLGTTAERLVRRSPVPVLLAAGPLDAAPRLLFVPVVAGDISERAFAWTRQLEQRFDPKVAVVHVEGPAPAGADPPQAGAARWRRLLADRAPDRVFTDAVWGDTARSILAESERFHSGLVVIDDRALESVHRTPTGHPADRLLRTTAHPLLVVVDRDGAPETAP